MDEDVAKLFNMRFRVITEHHLAAGRLDIYEKITGVKKEWGQTR
jgi:hypothetical protein